MAAGARDTSEDWVLAEAARPRSFAELEARVELAVETARSSETAVAEVGAAAIEAAEQARQAAELAERAASAAQLAADRAIASSAQPQLEPGTPPAEAAPAPVTAEEEWLVSFTHRAEQLSERLVRLQRV